MMSRHWKRITEVRLPLTFFWGTAEQHLVFCFFLFFFHKLCLLFCVKVTGHTFEVETDTFKLRNIMEAPLLKYKEEIEVSVVSNYVLNQVGRFESFRHSKLI